VSSLLASGPTRYQQFFGLLPLGLVAKTLLQDNWGRPFENEDTNSKHQYGSIRLAPSQKEHKGRHNS